MLVVRSQTVAAEAALANVSPATNKAAVKVERAPYEFTVDPLGGRGPGETLLGDVRTRRSNIAAELDENANPLLGFDLLRKTAL